MQASDRILFLVTLYFSAKRVKSQPSSATFRIIFIKLLLWCCEVQFSPWSSVDFSLELSSATCVQSLGKSASVVLRCSRMQGMSSLHTVLAGGMTCAFPWWGSSCCLYPMWVRYKPHGEKQEKTASLKHRINGKQKKNVRPTAQMEAK